MYRLSTLRSSSCFDTQQCAGSTSSRLCARSADVEREEDEHRRSKGAARKVSLSFLPRRQAPRSERSGLQPGGLIMITWVGWNVFCQP